MIVHSLRVRARSIRKRFHPQGYKEFFIQAALERSSANTYLEIGVRDGASFKTIQALTKIAVDPTRTPTMHHLSDNETFFELTSDEFFKVKAPDLLQDRPLGACLVDGLHTFEQSLDDVINASRWMASDGTIILDDCFPRTAERASLEPTGRAWNGDVWKTMALLRATQPQWDVWTLDVDEGVGLVTGFQSPYQVISADQRAVFKSLSYQSLADDPGLIGLRARP